MPALDPTTYDYREVPCPRCGASRGGFCVRPSGHSGPFVQAHADRRRAAEALWREEERERYGEIRSGFLRPAGGGPAASASGRGDPDQLDLF